MLISELQALLEEVKKKEGNIPVVRHDNESYQEALDPKIEESAYWEFQGMKMKVLCL